MLPGAVKNWQLAASDPYAWINDVVLPAYKAKGIKDPAAIQAHLGTMFQAATAAQMASIFATDDVREPGINTCGNALVKQLAKSDVRTAAHDEGAMAHSVRVSTSKRRIKENILRGA